MGAGKFSHAQGICLSDNHLLNCSRVSGHAFPAMTDCCDEGMYATAIAAVNAKIRITALIRLMVAPLTRTDQRYPWADLCAPAGG